MPADENHAVVHAVDIGQSFLQCPLHWALARHQTAGPGGRAVPLNGLFDRFVHFGMTVQPKIVVVGKIEIFLAVNLCDRTSGPFVHLEKRIAYAETLRCGRQHAQFDKRGVPVETGQCGIHRCARLGTRLP